MKFLIFRLAITFIFVQGIFSQFGNPIKEKPEDAQLDKDRKAFLSSRKAAKLTSKAFKTLTTARIHVTSDMDLNSKH